MDKPSSVALLEDADATGAGGIHGLRWSKRTFHAVGETSAGAGAATIKIQVSNVPDPDPATDADWIDLMTISLVLGTTRTGDGAASDAPWHHTRAKVTAISGTDATVSVYAGG